MNITQILAKKGTACRSGSAMIPQYITIHNTANTKPTATAISHGEYLRGAGASKAVSWHYAVDDTSIVQSIPDNEVAWHAGDGTAGKGNRRSLAIEICENQGGNLLSATDNAAKLTAFLMDKYSIELENVVQHNHWSGKNCPRRIRAGEPYSWAIFIGKVLDYLHGTAEQHKTTFIENLAPHAIESWRKHKILPSLTLAQAVVESANGTSELAINANNLFGIKSHKGWNGGDYVKETKEWNGTEYITIKASFCSYPTMKACVEDRAYKLTTMPRYANIIGETDIIKACNYIQQDGWATSPTYTTTLLSVVDKYNLTQYDKVVYEVPEQAPLLDELETENSTEQTAEQTTENKDSLFIRILKAIFKIIFGGID